MASSYRTESSLLELDRKADNEAVSFLSQSVLLEIKEFKGYMAGCGYSILTTGMCPHDLISGCGFWSKHICLTFSKILATPLPTSAFTLCASMCIHVCTCAHVSEFVSSRLSTH